jgi:copper transport protein
VGLFVLDVASVGFAHARWATLIVDSDPGRRALIGVQVALGIWWVSRLLPPSNESSRTLLVRILGVLASAMVVLAAYGGHGGVGGNAWVGLALRALHMGALAAWLGAVAVTWLGSRADRDWAAVWPSVSRLAAWGLALTGATGLLLSGRLVDTVTALLSTTYGRAVVAKIAVLLVLSTLGWFAARRVARGGSPRVVAAEIGLAVVALALAALLASSAPAKGEQFQPLPADEPQVITHDVADLTVTASLQPARPGANLVRVNVLDTRRPPLGPVEKVTMTLTRADGEVVATREGIPDQGAVEWADVELVSPGTYQVAVTVDRPAVPVPDVDDVFVVAATPVARVDTVVSDRDWRPIAVVSALGWLVLVALGRLAVCRTAQGSKR